LGQIHKNHIEMGDRVAKMTVETDERILALSSMAKPP
jgi:hypothetical protein